MPEADAFDDDQRALRIAVFAKQVPVPDSLELGPDGRLRREGLVLEMNPYCRRAVAKGVALARSSDGSCTAFTLGPPSAEDVLREAIAWGADEGVHLCDTAFAGSDTLATARALAAALRREGLFDLVLVGQASVDGGTGQVGPQLAELLDLPFASGARRMRVAGDVLHLGLEHEDGWEEVEMAIPAVVSVAERLCAPCKAPAEARAAVPAGRIRRVTAARLGGGPWGEAGSPTKVGATRALQDRRERRVLSGDLASQVTTALRMLAHRGALAGPATPSSEPDPSGWGTALPAGRDIGPPAEQPVTSTTKTPGDPWPAVAVLLQPDRPRAAAELLGAATRLAAQLDGGVLALLVPPAVGPAWPDREVSARLGALGADEVLRITARQTAAPLAAEDVAAALARWAPTNHARVLLAESSTFSREVAARTAAALGAGLIADAVAVDIVDSTLVARKSAFSGSLLADVTCTSPVQLVTVRPGVLTQAPSAGTAARVSCLQAHPRGRQQRRLLRQDDESDALGRAEVVVGIGRGVHPTEYADVQAFSTILRAELAATRKVTDQGWLPRYRQVGITGRSISPRLYVAIGLSGAANHMLGVRGAGTILAINADASAPVFQLCDVGILGDWREAIALLTSCLRAETAVPDIGNAPTPR
ncbi:MAG: FAD-binding protein [Acidimicrobiales bacterium]